jgi:hypothetical protein
MALVFRNTEYVPFVALVPHVAGALHETATLGAVEGLTAGAAIDEGVEQLVIVAVALSSLRVGDCVSATGKNIRVSVHNGWA